jgi:hypothetical protein
MEDQQSTEPVATQDAPVADPILDTLSDTEDVPEQSGVEETPAPVEDEAETPPEVEPTKEETEELQPEVDPKEEARRRYEERQRINAERRTAIESEVKQEAERYVAQGEDDVDQRLRATEARQSVAEAQQYVNNIEHNESTLVNEFERVKANPDLQIFNPENKEQFNQRAYDKALRDYNAGYLEYDQNGNMVGIKGSLFEHLTETAELFQGAVKSGAVQQVRATRRMRSTADAKPAATPKETAKDPILEILSSD